MGANLGRIMFLQKRRKKDAYYRGPVTPLEEDLFVEVVEQSNPVQMMFGTLVLWMGWYGLRSGLNNLFIFSKLRGARSRLYRRQILQVNIRWKALDEIYKMYILLHRSDLKISATKSS